ncbi:hypothetical protein NC651_034165 [Populus alba x Populus x berolinensis]|nr:hypothetical protein NC651_034165 [Populus alba x Populus x berolinensis]
MASVSATCPRFQSLFSQSDKTSRFDVTFSYKASRFRVSTIVVVLYWCRQLVSVGRAKCTGFPPLKASRFRVSCSVTPVETLEEEFDINVEEESSQNITSV